MSRHIPLEATEAVGGEGGGHDTGGTRAQYMGTQVHELTPGSLQGRRFRWAHAPFGSDDEEHADVTARCR